MSKHWWIAAAMSVAVMGGITRPVTSSVKSAQAEPLVSIPSGSTLADALAALHRASGGVILSEIPAVARKLDRAASNLSFTEALNTISRDYQLFCVRRGRNVVFLNRFTDPKEDLSLEVSDAQAVASDVYQLVHGVMPEQAPSDYEAWKKGFVATLTREQVQAMRNGGLPFPQLRPDQQRLWQKINITNAYSTTDREAGRLKWACDHWSACELQRIPGSGRFAGAFLFAYPNPQLPGRQSSLPFARGTQPQAPLRLGAGRGMDKAPANIRLAPFKSALDRVEGEMTLANLSDAIQQAARRPVQIPAQARGRRLLCYGSGARTEELIAALEDQSGWRFVAGTANRYYLRRPVATPAKDGWDLYEKLRAALPPHLLLIWSAETLNLRTSRAAETKEYLDEGIRKLHGENWTKVSVAELPVEMQQRVAGRMLDNQLRGDLDRMSELALPKVWYAAPERCAFYLEPPSQKGWSLFTFSGVSENRRERWGWGIPPEALPAN